ncbi:polyadenylate-binding protein-interacting protein 4 [Amborella trichopoda]|uniref:polyadenylate-binding protein-interacting protein 4 n=1 Tax=Amborella trichopoda TaxID=13333 RepID=UPI0005D2D89E|nr:polyadenylate-binding protein-interacting protein 4 [Amborella trichopoda]XP_020529664.1 polyadenylate-binding protein-interacting protein 4 [Amborella trichopoda]|eukprot:XP_011627318.1 polyadenylate-binding protein-interacting protein 4 [Amborella trichopoda]
MSHQQLVTPRPSPANGFGRRRTDREMGNRSDNRFHSGRSRSSSFGNAGFANGNKLEGYDSTSRNRLIFLTTCLVGHHVDVQVKNGSVFTGIFHATNSDKDFGLILKMARLTKDGSVKGQKMVFDSAGKVPSRTLIIPAKELVQVIAKDVLVTSNYLSNFSTHEKRHDFMIDTSISQSHLIDVERELEPWTPDNDDPLCPDLENTFDNTWNRNWDQFQTNEELFGVKSTFDEELYTTKLEKGPQMRELEREATRIAREIQGEDTQDPHLAEERGIHHLLGDLELDEESRFSSVFRGMADGAYEQDEDLITDAHITKMFGGSFDSATNSPGCVENSSYLTVTKRVSTDVTQLSSSFSLGVPGSGFPSRISASRRVSSSGVNEKDRMQASCSAAEGATGFEDVRSTNQEIDIRNNLNDGQINEQPRVKSLNEFPESKRVCEEGQIPKCEDTCLSTNQMRPSLDKGALSSSAAVYSPSQASPVMPTQLSGPFDSSISVKSSEATSSKEECLGTSASVKASSATQSRNLRARPGSSTSSTSEGTAAASVSSGPALSPCSSMGSLSSEKSTLNPNAKEFRLNPNAKSFTPSFTPLRPAGPVAEASFYMPTTMSAVPHMHSLPMGLGNIHMQIGPPFGGPQPLIYNPQAAPMPSPQAFMQPNGSLYGQQVILGQPRQVVYMPTYSPELQFKGREF